MTGRLNRYFLAWQRHGVAMFFATLFLIGGVVMTLGGMWLGWDWIVYTSFHPVISTPDWIFCYPGYIACVGPLQWTQPFDIAAGLIVAGALFLTPLGTLLVGYYSGHDY